MKKKKRGHRFQKGNKAAVGNRGPTRPDFLTQALISQLNELDRKTGKAKLHTLCAKLIAKALKGETIAIKEVFDRVQGKAAQALTTDDNGNFTIIVKGGLPDDED